MRILINLFDGQHFPNKEGVRNYVRKQLEEQGALDAIKNGNLTTIRDIFLAEGASPDILENFLAKPESQRMIAKLISRRLEDTIEEYTETSWEAIEQRHREQKKLLQVMETWSNLISQLRKESEKLNSSDQSIFKEVIKILESHESLYFSIVREEIQEPTDIEIERKLKKVLDSTGHELKVIEGSIRLDSTEQVVDLKTATQIAKYTEAVQALSTEIVNCIQEKLTTVGLEKLLTLLNPILNFKGVEIKVID